VLRGLTFSLEPGAITGLVGPSGSGKTTLMRALVGVQRISSGSLTVLGSRAGTPSLRGRIGYMAQSPSVYDDLTVRQNLRYFASICGHGAEVDDLIASVGLSSLARGRVRDLSGGERSRVSLAVALLGAPPVLVLDEPTVGLDPVLRRDLWAMFRAAAQAGATVLVSTHVMEEAERCDRLLLLREGELLAEGSPGALLRRSGTATLEDAFIELSGAQ
jgi:ABC-2 type transport system ATP-binding protein